MSDASRPPPADRGRATAADGAGSQVLRDREGTRGTPHTDTVEDGAHQAIPCKNKQLSAKNRKREQPCVAKNHSPLKRPDPNELRATESFKKKQFFTQEMQEDEDTSQIFHESYVTLMPKPDKDITRTKDRTKKTTDQDPSRMSMQKLHTKCQQVRLNNVLTDN